MKRFSLWVYVIAVIVTLAIVNWLAWRTGGAVEFVIDGRAAKKRQTQYKAVLKDYSDALKPGLSRREVESYLQLRGHPFRHALRSSSP
jgi:hypothetical protein